MLLLLFAVVRAGSDRDKPRADAEADAACVLLRGAALAAEGRGPAGSPVPATEAPADRTPKLPGPAQAAPQGLPGTRQPAELLHDWDRGHPQEPGTTTPG